KYYYELAANQGNDSAQNNLGYLYDNHFDDYEKAKYYYELSANQENDDAQYNLGLLYEDQFKDYEKAKYYYELAANQENDDAQYNLGLLYEKHFKNYEKEKYYYELASDQGNIDVKYLLYKLYCKLEDYEYVIYWINKHYDRKRLIYYIIDELSLNKYIINDYFRLKDENKVLKSELLKYEININELEYNFNK